MLLDMRITRRGEGLLKKGRVRRQPWELGRCQPTMDFYLPSRREIVRRLLERVANYLLTRPGDQPLQHRIEIRLFLRANPVAADFTM
jgi:hypothetical protein